MLSLTVADSTLVMAGRQAQNDVSQIANVPLLWILALSVFGVILVQSTIYLMAVRRNAQAANMTEQEVSKAFRAGGIAALGPSLAVVLVAIALLPLFGTPPVLVRIGLIGSAATEVASASVASATMGAELGGPGYNANVFVVALAAMSLSGAGWMIATLILTPIFEKTESSLQKVNPVLMTVVPSAALLAAFAALTITEFPKSSAHVIAVLASALVMVVCLFVAKVLKQGWLREWALGFSIVAGLSAAYFAHFNGLGPAA